MAEEKTKQATKVSHNKKGEIRDEKGRFVVPPKSPGRPKKTDLEKKIDKEITKTVKQYLAEYEEGLAEALPTLKPALIEKAKKGDMKAFAEIHKVLGAHKGGGKVTAVQVNFNKLRDEYE